MANVKKTYFLTPSFDYPPPPTGPIALGNILAGPTSPDRPLNPKKTLAALPSDAVVTTSKTDWTSKAHKENSVSVGLYAKFLDVILGAGADASVNWARGSENEYSFTRLDTTYFVPSSATEYLNSALRVPSVKQYLDKGIMEKSLYVITGLKIAVGGKASTSTSREHGGALSVGIDGSAFVAPVEVGPEMEVQRKHGEQVQWGGSDDFVFAYRVSRLKVKRKTLEMQEEEYVKGALYETKAATKESSFVLDDVEDDGAIVDEFEDELLDVQDEDGEDCFCLVAE